MAGHLPNNVAASLDPVVEDGEAGVGDEIGETHDCVCSVWSRRSWREWTWREREGRESA